MLSVADIMTREPYTLGPDNSLTDARNLMAQHHVRHVPVVSSDGTIVGLVSHRDVLAASDQRCPVHIHIAEQRREVEECLAATGARPVELLAGAGFSWRDDDVLVDPSGEPVEFSIISSSGASQRQQAATLIQEDLRQLGMKVTVVPLDHAADVWEAARKQADAEERTRARIREGKTVEELLGEFGMV